MYVCCKDFNLYDDGKCFSFSKGDRFFCEDVGAAKFLIENDYIVLYNYSKPAIRFTEVGIKFFEPDMETK